MEGVDHPQMFPSLQGTVKNLRCPLIAGMDSQPQPPNTSEVH